MLDENAHCHSVVAIQKLTELNLHHQVITMHILEQDIRESVNDPSTGLPTETLL